MIDKETQLLVQVLKIQKKEHHSKLSLRQILEDSIYFAVVPIKISKYKYFYSGRLYGIEMIAAGNCIKFDSFFQVFL